MRIQVFRAADGSHTTAHDEAGNAVQMYLPEIAGGAATGVRPMQMLIMGLGGCAAVDILLILKKQRQEVTDFRVDIEAEREANKEPALWQTAHLVFSFEGGLDPKKAINAIEMSMEKYCSVSATLRLAGASITWEAHVNGTLVKVLV
jgi:putative redox protein